MIVQMTGQWMTSLSGWTLAQSSRTARAQGEIWFYLVLLVIAAAIVVMVGLAVRKALLDPIESSAEEAVLDLSELRRLHREGKLSDEEYLAAKQAILSAGANVLHGDDQEVDLGPELLDTPDIPAPPESESGPSTAD